MTGTPPDPRADEALARWHSKYLGRRHIDIAALATGSAGEPLP